MTMSRSTITALVTAMITAGMTPPAIAGGFDPDRVERIQRESLGGWRARSLAAGISLRVPLSPNARLQPERTEMRLDLGIRQATLTGAAPSGYGIVHRPVYRLSMRFDDPESLSLNGMRFADFARLSAGEQEGEANKESKKRKSGINWWWVGGGVAFLVAGGVAAGAAAGSAGKAAAEAIDMALFCQFNKKDPRCQTSG